MGSVVLSVVEEMRGMARGIYVYVGWLSCHIDVTIFARRRTAHTISDFSMDSRTLDMDLRLEHQLFGVLRLQRIIQGPA